MLKSFRDQAALHGQLEVETLDVVNLNDQRRYHAQGRPCRASQLRHLPDAAHQRSAGDRGPYRPKFEAAGRDWRTRNLGDRPSGRQRDLCGDYKRVRKLPIDAAALKQPV